MTGPRLQFLNWFLLMIVMAIACGFQTTFWFQIVGSVPAPLLWLNLVLYVILYRKGVEGILINYALGLIMAPFTSMSLGMIWSLLLLLSVVTNFAKKRIFWPGLRYYIIASFGITLVYQILSFTLSTAMESNSVQWNFVARTVELLFTPLFSAPIYWLMTYVDRISEKDPLPERGVLP